MDWRVVALLALMRAFAPTGAAAAQDACRYGHTQAALTRCANEEARAEIKRLDALLARLYSKLVPSRSAALRRVQADWVRVRDAHCEWDAGSYAGGSVMPMWYANCVGAATHARVDDLRFHLCDDDAGMAGECSASRAFADPPGKERPRR